MQRDVYPLQLSLPDGRRADLVPGSRPARYTIDGQACDISVELPDDLAAMWFWHGSALAYDDRLWISTATYPPPGFDQPTEPIVLKSTNDEGRPQVEIIERGTCFDAARQFSAKRAEVRAMLDARPAKKAKKKAAPVAVAEIEQMELFAA